MYCSECGKPVQGKFCSNCGNPLGAAAGTETAVAVAEPVNWETEHRYEVLMRVPSFRAAIERHAGMAKKVMSGEEFMKWASKLVPHGEISAKAATLAQPLYASWGIGTGKERTQQIDAPIGRTMLRALCSMARHSQSIRGVKQASDGCFFEAVLPSDMWSFDGDLLVTVRRATAMPDARTEVSAAAKLKGQMFDPLGKCRKCLDQLYTDLQLDPG